MKKLLFVAVLFIGSAQAAPVIWTLNDVLFSDGATASGTFTYDVDTNVVSSESIVTNPSVGGPQIFCELLCDLGATYPGVLFGFPTGTPTITFFTGELTGFPTGIIDVTLVFSYLGALSNAGGVVPLAPGIDLEPGIGSFETIVFDIFNSRAIVSGNVSAVPIPAAVWLFGSGLGLLGWFRKKA